MQLLGYTRLGTQSGRPLAIIHGWGCDSTCMQPLAQMFSLRDVFLIDLPGYGKSAHLQDLCSDFSATNYLLLNTLPAGCDVISWSFGSIYALRAISTLYNPCLNMDSFIGSIQANANLKELTLKYPTKGPSEFTSVLQAATRDHPRALLADKQRYIRSLITICGSPRFPCDPNWQGLSAIKILKCNTQLTPQRLQRILKIFYRLIVSTEETKAPSGNSYPAFLNKRPEVPYEVLMAGIKMVTYLDERPSLSHLKVPSLHLFGRHDPLVPCSLANYFEQYVGHKSYIFEHSSHSPMFTEPELFCQIVNNFYHSLDLGQNLY